MATGFGARESYSSPSIDINYSKTVQTPISVASIDYQINWKAGFLRLFFFALFILLIITLVRFTNGSYKVPTFTGLLEKFSNSPPVTIGYLNWSSIVLGDWGIFNFFRDFVSGIASIVNVLLFFCNGLLSVIQYVVWFFQWVFVF